jgi:hypothetical protein
VLVGLFVWMLAYLHKLDATAPLPSAPPDRTSRPLQRP